MSTDPAELKQTLGWQGFTLQVPADWTVGAVSGDRNEGSLRVDGLHFPRLELWWSTPKGAVDLEERVERYLRHLERAGRGGASLEVERDSRFISNRKLGKGSIKAFIWKREQTGYGVAWFCRECGRQVMAQFLAQPDEGDVREQAVAVLAAIQDHPKTDWTTWALYDLHTEVPQGFVLSGTELRAGLTRLNFTRGSERLCVARWGMAETALRDRTLQDWATKELGKALRQYEPAGEETEYRSHPALRFTGQALSPLGLGLRLARHLGGKHHADQLLGYVWHCDAANRLLVVYGIVDVAHRSLIEEVRDRTRCHATDLAGG